ncbi:hypothetical protein STEG23_011510, partial [Scotinomys teguina]
MEYYAAEKNNDIMKFAGKWMELENVILSEVVVFLSLSIPILDCHHTWCYCGIPSDFYYATQT